MNTQSTSTVYTKEGSNELFAGKGRKVYFKKTCPEWSAPRAYFFDTYIYSERSWVWGNSPYMTDEGDGLYSILIPCGYRYVVFFCDVQDGNTGGNYKTSDLRLPPMALYANPVYLQSEIGYDGIWADYNSGCFDVYIQDGLENGYTLNSLKVDYTTAAEPALVKTQVLQYRGYIGSLCYSCTIPADTASIAFTAVVNGTEVTTGSRPVMEYCYNVPVMSVKNSGSNPPEFSTKSNGLNNTDFYRHFTENRELKNKADRNDVYLKNQVYTRAEADSRYASQEAGTFTLTVGEGAGNGANGTYTRTGNVVTMEIWARFTSNVSSRAAFSGVPVRPKNYPITMTTFDPNGNFINCTISGENLLLFRPDGNNLNQYAYLCFTYQTQQA